MKETIGKYEVSKELIKNMVTKQIQLELNYKKKLGICIIGMGIIIQYLQ